MLAHRSGLFVLILRRFRATRKAPGHEKQPMRSLKDPIMVESAVKLSSSQISRVHTNCKKETVYPPRGQVSWLLGACYKNEPHPLLPDVPKEGTIGELTVRPNHMRNELNDLLIAA